jgi:hypothetical protein
MDALAKISVKDEDKVALIELSDFLFNREV